MKLGDRAAESPEVSLVRQSSPGLYRVPNSVESIEEIDLVSADDLTAEGEFPQYGEFLEVQVTHGGPDPTVNGSEYIECPGALAKWLVEEAEPGDWFHIQTVQKVDGEWQYELEIADDPTE